MKEIYENSIPQEMASMPQSPERGGLQEKIDAFLHTSRQIGSRILQSTIGQWETLRQNNTVVRELTDASLWKAEWQTTTQQVKSLPRPKVGEAYNSATAWVSTQYMIERGEAGRFNPSAFKERFSRRRHGQHEVETDETTTTNTANKRNFSRKTGVAVAVVLGAGALYILNETYPGNDFLGNHTFDPLDADANLFDGEFSVDFFDQDVDGRVDMGGEQLFDSEAHQAFNDIKDGYTDLAEELDQEIPDIDDGDWESLQDWGDELHELDDKVAPPEGQLFGPEAPEIDSNPGSGSGSGNGAEKGQVFYVEPTHGITHEIVDYAEVNGYGTISPEESYRIYQQLEAQHANALLDILNGVDDTYLDENGDTLLSRSGNARWDPTVETHLRRMLLGMK